MTDEEKPSPRTRKTRSDKGQKRERQTAATANAPKAALQLDERLQGLLSALDQANDKITSAHASVSYWQQKKSQLAVQIEETIAYLDRLCGRAMAQVVSTPKRVDPLDVLKKVMPPQPPMFSDVPEGAGSIPAGQPVQRGPKPTSPNVAYDRVVTEGGFS